MKLFGENFSNLAKKTTSTKLLAIVLAFALLVTNVTMMTGGITASAEDLTSSSDVVTSDSNVSGTDVSGANVSRTDVSGADVSGTDVSGAVSSDADVSATDSSIDEQVVTYTVNFYAADNSLLSSQQVVSGEAAEAPVPPAIDGYAFYSWSSRFDNVQQDLNIIAQYEAVLMTMSLDPQADDTMMTVYAYNPGEAWSEVNVYAFTTVDDTTTKHTGDWPGTAMAVLGDGWYYYDVPVGCTVIFNGDGQETGKLTLDATNCRAIALNGANYVSSDAATVEAAVTKATTTINYYPTDSGVAFVPGGHNGWDPTVAMTEGSDGFLTNSVSEWIVKGAGASLEFKILNVSGDWNTNLTSYNLSVTKGETVYLAHDGNGVAETKDDILYRMGYDITVYNAAGWSDAYIYTYNSDIFGAWPGTKMTAGSDNTYTMRVPAGSSFEGVIINNGAGSQTGNILCCSEERSFIYTSTSTTSAYATLQQAKDAANGVTLPYSFTVNVVPAKDSTTSFYFHGGFGASWAGQPDYKSHPALTEATSADGTYYTYTLTHDNVEYFDTVSLMILDSVDGWNSAIGVEKIENLALANGSLEIWLREGSGVVYATEEEARDTSYDVYAYDGENWGSLYIYTFNSEIFGTWTGTAMEPASELGTGWYKASIEYGSTYEAIIINNGKSDPDKLQTGNIADTKEADKYIYAASGTTLSYTSAEEALEGKGVPEVVEIAYYIYAYNAEGWDSLKAYTFNSEIFGTWSGTAMESASELGDGWYKIGVPAGSTYEAIIINGNGAQSQTGNICDTTAADRYIYAIADTTCSYDSAEEALEGKGVAVLPEVDENAVAKFIVHYARTDSDPSGWYLYGGWDNWIGCGSFIPAVGTDSFGTVYTVTADKGQAYSEFNFLLVEGSGWGGPQTADKKAALDDQLFAEVWLTDDGELLTECPDGFESTMLTVHYGRTAHDYDGWKIRVSANADGSDYVEQSLSDQDVFGAYASAVVDGENTALYYTITNGTDVEGTAWTEVPVSGSNEEIWVTEGVDGYELTQPEIVNDATSTKVIIHYQRPNNNYAGWGVWSWHDNGGSKDNEFYYEDDWGRVAIIEYDEVLDSIGIVIHQRAIIDDLQNLWHAKDGGDRIITVRNGFAEVWITASLDVESTVCPNGATSYDPAVGFDKAADWQQYLYITMYKITGAEVIIHYLRENNDYEDWTVWIWGNNLNVGASYDFLDPETNNADYDEYREYEKLDERICRISLDTYPTDKLGMIVRYKEWEDKDIEKDRFIEIDDMNNGEVRHIYLYQGVEEVYTEPVPEEEIVFNTAPSDLL